MIIKLTQLFLKFQRQLINWSNLKILKHSILGVSKGFLHICSNWNILTERNLKLCISMRCVNNEYLAISIAEKSDRKVWSGNWEIIDFPTNFDRKRSNFLIYLIWWTNTKFVTLGKLSIGKYIITTVSDSYISISFFPWCLSSVLSCNIDNKSCFVFENIVSKISYLI